MTRRSKRKKNTSYSVCPKGVKRSPEKVMVMEIIGIHIERKKKREQLKISDARRFEKLGEA